jgi:hypothetical protein
VRTDVAPPRRPSVPPGTVPALGVGLSTSGAALYVGLQGETWSAVALLAVAVVTNALPHCRAYLEQRLFNQTVRQLVQLDSSPRSITVTVSSMTASIETAAPIEIGLHAFVSSLPSELDAQT